MNTLKIANTIGANSYPDVEISEKFLPDFSYETGEHFKNVNQKLIFHQVMGVKDKVLYNWNPDFLIEYIINLHHQPAKENAVFIYDMAQEVLYKHSGNHPELAKLAERIYFFFDDFLLQMRTEEELLFPEIKKLSEMKKHQETDSRSHCDDVKKLVINLHKKHVQAIEELREIRKIAKGYTGSSDIYASFKELYKKIRKFENDLTLHIHLESDILFPKTLALTEILAGKDERVPVVA